MKYLFLFLIFVIVVGSASSCERGVTPESNNNILDTIVKGDTMSNKIKIKVNSQTFSATLLDNNSTRAFLKMLPMTVNMKELNGDEKYYDLPERLPTNASNPRTIKAGDLMLFGSNTVVLFYKSFTTSYSYTRLGSIDDVSGLATALGSKNVMVTFEVK